MRVKIDTKASMYETSIKRRTSKLIASLAGGVLIVATIGLAACSAGPYTEANGLPNTLLTPGATNPQVTQANIHSNVCVSGWTKTVRPPVTYTNPLKYSQLHSGYNLDGDFSLKDYEEDHQVPLEVGGSPSSVQNLWPEPRNIRLGATVKDQLENRMHDLLCAGQVTLKTAQTVFMTNWQSGYKKYIGPLP
jgi:hypothetical protein